ncbi:MAG: HlyD family efflux transporter periplasmic adaptor subunit [Nitrospira sp.]|nr:HlyD family efflux transporter periplasmic adaptor subunit [Nitrospira sp.]MDH4303839.1 HlyD family efflux transporter periplasmic adaptor subunit [Nitrospira sp.]MDH5193356.1 HlyD family efflux transporter periplasmic adaptor subunit [Nitrospira sp.]
MMDDGRWISHQLVSIGLVVMVGGALAGCNQAASDLVQGYVEGEYVYVASPYGGALATLSVRRGAQVNAGDSLFVLEQASEKATRDEAERKLSKAKATLEDTKKGKRPSEIESLRAQLRQAQTALQLSLREVARQEGLGEVPGAAVQLEVDRARSARDQNQQRVSQLEADLKTALLGSRTDLVAAAEAEVRAKEAALAKAEWDLAQKRQVAPKAGFVFDTLYREGEWVPAGRPVVVLLPPDHIKVRAFVSQARLGGIKLGDLAQVTVDGGQGSILGTVSYISPKAEYTPPMLYSQGSRDKLVFLVEVLFEQAVAVNLHPGQPVDIRFNGVP